MQKLQAMEPIMANFPWLTLLVVFPALVGALIWLIPPLRKQARPIALGASLVELVGVIVVMVNFDFTAAGQVQAYEQHAWIPQIGASWALGVSGLGLALVALAAVLVPIVIGAAWSEDEGAANPVRSSAGYVSLILILESFMVLIFAARDLLLFYIAFEAMLIPVYFMVGVYGGENRRKAALKFLLYSLFGGLVMLFGVIGAYVYVGGGEDAFLLSNLADKLPQALAGHAGMEMALFISFFVAFAIKAPMVPVHTWLPDTAAAARPGTSVLLVGVLDKIGTFGMITMGLALFPAASAKAAVVIIVLAVISVIYGGLAALGQKDLMRLVSFTSVSHFGFIVMGIYVGSAYAMAGAMVYMVAHGLSIAGMFLIGGFLTQRAGTQQMSEFGGMQRVTPLIAGTFLVSGLAAVALPGLSGFIPEYMVLIGTFSKMPAAAGIAGLGVIIACVYLLWPYQVIFTGKPNPQREGMKDMNWREKLVVTPLILLMLFFGLYPKPLVDLVTPVADQVTAVVTTDAGASSLDGGGSK